MGCKQVYYTSCQSGLRGSPGFQTQAASPGIPPGVLQQIERLCVYVPPVSAPSRPGEQELAEFPLSLVYQRLADGHTILAQARYLGADYSGRFGNYFAHALLTQSPARDLGERLPIELWRSPFFSTTQSPTPELAEVELPSPERAIELPQVSRLLTENGRLEHVADFITAVEQALRTRRRVVLIDTSDAVAHWIAAACFVLPRHLALQLTFNTYVKNPYQSDALIVGTTVDSDFGFAPHEIRHMVYLFDFVGGRFTPIEQPSTLGRSVMAAFRAGTPERITGFAAFVAKVAPELPLEQVDIAFAACCGLAGVTGCVVPELDRMALANFCAPLLPRFAQEQIGALFAQCLRGEATEQAVSATRILMKAVRRAGIAAPAQQAAEAALIAWVAGEAARTASLACLPQLVEELPQSTELRLTALAQRSGWLSLLGTTEEPLRLLLLLLIGERLGYLEGLDDTLRKLGEGVVGPALGDAQVGQRLRQIAGRSSGRPLLEGIAAYLLARVAEPQLFRQLGSLLAEPELARVLLDWAVQNHALLLRFRLIGAQADREPHRRPAAFARCLEAAASQTGGVKTDHAERAFEAVWLAAPPTAEEGLRLCAAVPPEVLAASTLPARLTGCLLPARGVKIEPAQRELAALLGGGALRAALGEKVGLLELFAKTEQLAADDWRSHLAAALACAQRSGREAAHGVCYLAAERVVKESDPTVHRQLIERALAACPWFAEAYVAVTEQLFRQGVRPAPPIVVGLLKVWVALSRHPEYRGTAEHLLTSVLPIAVQDFGRQEKAAAEAALGPDKEARAHLRAALAGDRRRGLLELLSSLFLGLSMVVLLWQLRQRLPPEMGPGAQTPPHSAAAGGAEANVPPQQSVRVGAARAETPPPQSAAAGVARAETPPQQLVPVGVAGAAPAAVALPSTASMRQPDAAVPRPTDGGPRSEQGVAAGN